MLSRLLIVSVGLLLTACAAQYAPVADTPVPNPTQHHWRRTTHEAAPPPHEVPIPADTARDTKEEAGVNQLDRSVRRLHDGMKKRAD